MSLRSAETARYYLGALGAAIPGKEMSYRATFRAMAIIVESLPWPSLLMTRRVNVHVKDALTRWEKQLGMDIYKPTLGTYRG